MKRSVAWMVGVLSVGAAAYFSTKLFAQTNRPAASAQTRVAMLNLRWVIKHYDKYVTFIESMKREEKDFIGKLQAKQKEAEAIAKTMENAKGADKEAKEQKLRDIQRYVEDLKLSTRKEVAQKSQDVMVQVYREVRNAAYRHAQAHNFDLVLHFEGPAEKDEADNPVLIMRNINAGGCVPLYWNSALDISGHVLSALNGSTGAKPRSGK